MEPGQREARKVTAGLQACGSPALEVRVPETAARPCARPSTKGPGHRIWRGRGGRRIPHLGHEEEDGCREPSHGRRRRHVGWSPPQASPDVSQQRPGAVRRAAQALYMVRACVRAGSKGATATPAQSGATRQNGGEREAVLAGHFGWATRGLAALLASRALLPLQDKEKKKKESILDLSKYIDKTIRVKFQGGREGKAPAPAPS